MRILVVVFVKGILGVPDAPVDWQPAYLLPEDVAARSLANRSSEYLRLARETRCERL